MDVKDLTEKEFVGQIGRPAVTQKKKQSTGIVYQC